MYILVFETSFKDKLHNEPSRAKYIQVCGRSVFFRKKYMDGYIRQ